MTKVINIWGRLKGQRNPEIIDRAVSVRDASYLLGEYQLAFGKSWKIWIGRKIDEPKEEVSGGRY